MLASGLRLGNGSLPQRRKSGLPASRQGTRSAVPGLAAARRKILCSRHRQLCQSSPLSVVS